MVFCSSFANNLFLPTNQIVIKANSAHVHLKAGAVSFLLIFTRGRMVAGLRVRVLVGEPTEYMNSEISFPVPRTKQMEKCD